MRTQDRKAVVETEPWLPDGETAKTYTLPVVTNDTEAEIARLRERISYLEGVIDTLTDGGIAFLQGLQDAVRATKVTVRERT